MKTRHRAMLSFAVLVTLVIGLYYFTQWFSLTTGYVLGEDEKVALGECLASKNAVFYVSETCPDCYKQRALFGETAFEPIHTITCTTRESCEHINAFPAWQFGQEIQYGFHEFEELATISGCSLH